MSTRPRLRPAPWLAGTTTAALVAGLLGLASPVAVAAEGPAPAPSSATVLSKVHTDAISTFLDAGEFSLGTKADTPDTGTRYEPEDVWFHVDDASQTTLPASGYEFVGPAGSQVWIAPETNPGGEQLWPGFSTEGVPAGSIRNDTTTFTLTDVSAPTGGSVEVFTGGGTAPVTRRWSSDEAAVSTFTLGRTHSHANWAFTKAGTYELTVRAQATLGGAAVSDTATYTWVVGGLPEQVATTTTLTATPTTLSVGQPVALRATVDPAWVEGAVEFRRGTTVLGHDPVVDGRAELTVPDLPVGSHPVTAAFIPASSNLAAGSVSAPTTIDVTDATGAAFAVTGVQPSYVPGDTLDATVVGADLGSGESLRWYLRPIGSTSAGTSVSTTVPTAFRRKLSIADDGYELGVAVRKSSVNQRFTRYVPIEVVSDVEPLALTRTSPAQVYVGDAVTATVSGRALVDGESLRVVRRFGTPWSPAPLSTLENGAIRVRTQQSASGGTSYEFALQVMRDGVAVAQSAPFATRVDPREVMVSGVRAVYRLGRQVEADATVFPSRDGLRYRWELVSPTGKARLLRELPAGTDSTGIGVQFTPTLDEHGHTLRLTVLHTYPEDGTTVTVGTASSLINVSDAPADQQLFFFNPLAAHYHQGEVIKLDLSADPELTADDFVYWEWKFPTSEDWTYLEGTDGLAHRITAEQALQGVQVRATLYRSTGDTFVADPVTIDIDDHGAPARQVPTIGGPTTFTEGEGLALGVVLPAGAATVLTDHRWERRAAGSDEWSVVEGQTAKELASAATLADDGASYRVSVVKPGGVLAYGPSAPVTVRVVAETATGFGLAGVDAGYQIGDVLRARVVGRPLSPGQTWRFAIRPGGSDSVGSSFYGDGDYAATLEGRVRQALDASHDGYQIRARLREGGAFVEGADTGWATIEVETTDAPLTLDFPEGPLHNGEEILLPFDRVLAPDESVRLAYRSGGTWVEASYTSVRDGFVAFMPYYGFGEAEYALQLLRDGRVVATSPPVVADIKSREALVRGVRGIYRVGDVLSATAEVFPPLDGVTYRWSLVDAEYRTTVLEQGTGADALRVELPMTADLDHAYLSFEAILDHPEHGRLYVASWGSELRVSTAPADQQLFFFESLGGHYHQGGGIDLDLVADPGLTDGDTVTWEWKWPGTEWAPFPGASGLSHDLVAEQALDGVEVRATLDPADEAGDLTTEPVTIHVDDHGSPARQRPTVAGRTAVTVGETAVLQRVLPDNGATVLTTHRWERQAEGSQEWTPVEGQDGAELSVPVTPDEDGASYRVSILTPGGEVAYGPSPAVTLDVSAAPEPRLVMTATPTIIGERRVGEMLTVSGDDWSVAPDEVQISWLGTGHSGRTYTLTPADLERGVQVEMVATRLGYTTSAVHRTERLAVEPGRILATALPRVSGEPVVGQTLRVGAATWSTAPDAVGHQWLADGEVIEGATSDELVLTEDLLGAEVSALLTATKQGYTDATAVSATAGPVRSASSAVETTVAADSVEQVYGRAARLAVTVSPDARGQVEVDLGRRTVRAPLSGGRAVVQVPARALRPGRHRLDISYAGVEGEFLASRTTAVLRVVRADPRMRVAPVRAVGPGEVPVVRIRVGADGVVPTGRVRVRVAGRQQTVSLDARGRAVVRMVLPTRATPGMKPVWVSYLGDDQVRRVTSRTVVRVTG